LRRKEYAIRYDIKPKEQVIGISIKKQDKMQGEVLLVSELESTAGKKNVYRVAKQIFSTIQAGCSRSKLCERCKCKNVVENDQVKEEWRKYMEKLLNE